MESANQTVSFADAFLPYSDGRDDQPHVVCSGRGFVVTYQEALSHVKASIIMQAAVNTIATNRQALVISLSLSASSAPIRTLTPLSSLNANLFQRLEFAYVESVAQACELLAATGTPGDASAADVPDVIVVDLDGMAGRQDHYAVGKLLAVLDHTANYLRRIATDARKRACSASLVSQSDVECAPAALQGTTASTKPLPYFVVALDDSVSLPRHHVPSTAAKLRSFPLASSQNPLVELRPAGSRDTVLITLTELSGVPTPLAMLQYAADSVSVRLLPH